MITTDLHVNQIVRVGVGTYVILGFRVIGNKGYAQLKAYNPETKRTARGELSLPLDILVPFENI